MQNKTNWIAIIAVVIVVALVTSLITIILMGNSSISLSPASSALSSCISDCQKQNSCNSNKLKVAERNTCKAKCDTYCSEKTAVYTKAEVDSLIEYVTSQMTNIVASRVTVDDSLEVRSSSEVGFLANLNGIFTNHISTPLGTTLSVDSYDTTFKGSILSDSLIGAGTAYACINYNGALFRSNVTCR